MPLPTPLFPFARSVEPYDAKDGIASSVTITGVTYAAFFTKDLRDRSSTRSSLFTVPPTRSVASPDASKSTDSQKVRKRRVNVVDYHCAAIWVAGLKPNLIAHMILRPVYGESFSRGS